MTHPDRLKPLGTILTERGLATANDIEKALHFQQEYSGRLGSILVRLGVLSEETLLPVLAQQTGYGLLESALLPSEAAVQELATSSGLTVHWLMAQQVLLWELADGSIAAASRTPQDGYLQEALLALFPNKSIQWFYARSSDIENRLKQFTETRQTSNDIAHLKELAEEAPVIELVNNMLSQAVDERASDVHVEPGELEFFVRLRIDGVLYERLSLPRHRFDAVASRIKLIAGLDIAERRLPQDGRLSTRASGAEMDIRVSVIPGIHGESIVMRLLPKERKNLSLEHLGLLADHFTVVERWAQEPHGIVLVTGPTGSGKSTTLYATLAATNDRRRKIITVEDPVEYQMPGITQIQAHNDIGYSFARALRAILRHDPDVIMIGEIRDRETAEIAIQASLTGHTVFSTIHTNDAVSTVNRLLDMEIEPFLVASSLRGIVAQRLVRKLCERCAAPATLEDWQKAMVRHLPNDSAQWRQPVGCTHCQGTGFRGRLGVFELIDITPELQEGILARESAGVLARRIDRQQFRTMRTDGLLKAQKGWTTIDEVMRVVGAGSLSEEMAESL